MSTFPLALVMMAAGAMIAFQSPINASLARNVGAFEAALVSFATGTGLLLLVVLLRGKGNVRALAGVPAWQYLGGLLGAAYITAIILLVPRIGVGSLMVTALTGQLGAALLIDRMGWFGLAARPLDARRLAAVALLFVAVLLMTGRK